MPEPLFNFFSQYEREAWPFRYRGRLKFESQVRGGIPSNPDVAAAWIKTKMYSTDAQIQALVAETMIDRGIDANAAVEEVNKLKNLTGFKRDDIGLYIEGRQLKAAIKEASVVAMSAKKIPNKGYGVATPAGKSLRPFVAEHVFVEDEKLYLLIDGKPIQEPSGVDQKFVHTFQGNSISYEEYVTQPEIEFTITTDWEFSDRHWALMFLTGGKEGLGASRSQGFGRYAVQDWKREE
jgi:hypothetical protein